MIEKEEIDKLLKIEKNNYNDILAAIDNIPPCFNLTKRNIKEKIDKYIQSTTDINCYFNEKFYKIGFVDGYSFLLESFKSERNDNTNE